MSGITIISVDEMVPVWASDGIAKFERYLARHAAFETWLHERTVLSAA